MPLHAWNPDADGLDCLDCPLPEKHPTHTRDTAPSTPPAPALAPVRDLGVRQSPEQPQTSQDAATTAWPRAGSKRAEVLEAIGAAGEYGCTDDDLAFDTDLSPNTVRPRRGELVAAGWVTQARDEHGRPRTRPSAQGNEAAVWVLTPAAAERLDAA